MGEWEFYRIPVSGQDNVPFHWSWRCYQDDGRIAEAAETFRFLLDCVAHARLNGYDNGPMMLRRECAPLMSERRPVAAALN